MIAIVNIISRHTLYSLSIDVHHRNQPNKKSKLALYKLLIHINCHLKQLYIVHNTESISYKGGCGVCGRMCIDAFKIRAGMG